MQISSIVVTILLYYVLTAVWLGPAYIPDNLGPVSRVLLSAHKNYSDNARQGIIAIPAIHTLECIVALVRCRQLGIGGATVAAWLLQTLAFGIGSLKFLLWPAEDARPKRH